jgi:hypothetical protein
MALNDRIYRKTSPSPMIWLITTTSNGGGFEMSFQTIDLQRRCIEIYREHGLTPFRKVLDPSLFRSLDTKKHRSNTVLVPEVVVWLMVSAALWDGTMVASVQNFWTPLLAFLPGLPLRPVTDSAFCTARKELALGYFRELFLAVVQRFDRAFSDRYRWKGLRLFGLDGSRVPLSPLAPKLRKAFPSTARKDQPSKNPLALLVSIVGLRDGHCKDFELVSLQVSEQACARRLIQRCVGLGDLVLFDKNFVGYETFAYLLLQKAQFLFRLASNRYTQPKRCPTPSGRKDEWYITLVAPKGLRGVCPGWPETMTLRVLEYQHPGYRTSQMITSLLDVHEYPYEELVALYHERWAHETVIGEWKHTLQISNLRSHSPEGVLKEVYAQLTLNNAIRWIMAEAAGEETFPVHLQFLNTKRLLLSFIPVMVRLEPLALARTYRRLLLRIAQFHILKRPGRSYPRRFDKKPRHKGGGAYAQPARLLSLQEEAA